MSHDPHNHRETNNDFLLAIRISEMALRMNGTHYVADYIFILELLH